MIDVIELARRLDPSINLHEVRPGVIRKPIEWSTEQWCRVVIAARAQGISPSKFVRLIVQSYIYNHTELPPNLPPEGLGLNKKAWQEMNTVKLGNQGKLEDPFAGLAPPVVERLKS